MTSPSLDQAQNSSRYVGSLCSLMFLAGSFVRIYVIHNRMVRRIRMRSAVPPAIAGNSTRVHCENLVVLSQVTILFVAGASCWWFVDAKNDDSRPLHEVKSEAANHATAAMFEGAGRWGAQHETDDAINTHHHDFINISPVSIRHDGKEFESRRRTVAYVRTVLRHN